MPEPPTDIKVEIIDKEEENGEKVVRTGEHWHREGNKHMNFDKFSWKIWGD